MGRVTTCKTHKLAPDPGVLITATKRQALPGGGQLPTDEHLEHVMPGTSAPSPAYTATLTPWPLHHPALRRVRLSSRQVDTLKGREIPIPLTSPSRLTRWAQAEVAIQDATRPGLGREVCAVLHRDRDGGHLYVMAGGRFVPVASVELVPAQRTERAA